MEPEQRLDAFGGPLRERFWKRPMGYHAQSRIEAQVHRLARLGERMASEDPDCQVVEVHAHIA